MIKTALIELFERDLNHIKTEIENYSKENNIWLIGGEIKNSSGNLCLHLIGNLNYFIGAVLGNTGYIRHREHEFTQKNIPIHELLKNIDETISVVKTTLKNLTPNDFEKEYPIEVLNRKWSTFHFLLHLSSHLNYHLGQINYHRRLLDIN